MAPAHYVADDIVTFARVRRTKIHVIPNPVIDDDLWARASEPLDHPWFQPRQPPVVLGVGRLVHQKRFDLLVDAFHHVRARHNARLLILGDGTDREPLLRRARRTESATTSRCHDSTPIRCASWPAPGRRVDIAVRGPAGSADPGTGVRRQDRGHRLPGRLCGGPRRRRPRHLVRSADPQVFGDALLSALRATPTTNERASWYRYTVDTAVQRYRTLIAAVTDPDVPATR